jgi:uncharacterized membrane protein
MLRRARTHRAALLACSLRYKTATWKVFAIASTVLVATVYGNYNFAIKLGPIDTVFKSINYYIHELAWDRVTWGTTPKKATVAKKA